MARNITKNNTKILHKIKSKLLDAKTPYIADNKLDQAMFALNALSKSHKNISIIMWLSLLANILFISYILYKSML